MSVIVGDRRLIVVMLLISWDFYIHEDRDEVSLEFLLRTE